MFYTHSWEKREPVKEKKKNDLNPTTVEAAALATAVSLFYADLTIYKKRFLDIFLLNASAEISGDGVKWGKTLENI